MVIYSGDPTKIKDTKELASEDYNNPTYLYPEYFNNEVLKPIADLSKAVKEVRSVTLTPIDGANVGVAPYVYIPPEGTVTDLIELPFNYTVGTKCFLVLSPFFTEYEEVDENHIRLPFEITYEDAVAIIPRYTADLMSFKMDGGVYE